jgi:hypothetical protein
MKRILILVLFISLVASVYATSNITVESMNYFATSKDSKTSIDWSGDSLTVEPGDHLQLQIKYSNTYTEDITVETTGTLDMMETIKQKKTVTVPYDDFATIVLEYDVPADMNTGYYELALKYGYIINGTNYNDKTTVEVNVRKKVITTEQATTQTSDVLANLTKELVDSRKVTSNLLTITGNCTADLATCKQALGTCASVEDFKKMYNDKCAAYDSLQSQQANKIDKTECDRNIETAKTQAASDASGSSMKTILIVGLIAVIVWFIWDRNRKVSAAGPGTSARNLRP